MFQKRFFKKSEKKFVLCWKNDFEKTDENIEAGPKNVRIEVGNERERGETTSGCGENEKKKMKFLA